MISLITATTLDDWAKKEPKKAQEILPQLLIRLILLTTQNIDNFNFPIEKGIQFSGYDGVLVSGEKTAFFPAGKSVWEFGTNDDALGKFNSDIEKRYKNPLGVDVTDTVFIFTTMKIWNHKISIEELVNTKKNIYTWKDIQIIDASKLSLWLGQSPSVAIWINEIIGTHIDGLISLDQYWSDHCHTTTPTLTKEFFLVGRETVTDQLSKWLKNTDGYRMIKADSTLEAILFAISTVLTLPENEKNTLLGQILIVTSSAAWSKLIAKNLKATILLPIFNFTEDIRCPQGINALLPVNRYSPFSKISKNMSCFELPKLTKSQFHAALECSGYTASDFHKIETITKRNFLPFYRNITNLPMQKQPKWSFESNLEDLIPAMLLGGWNADYEGDKKAVETLSELNYDQYINKLKKWIAIEDAPVFNVLSSYQVVSSQDLWTFIFDVLTAEDIKRLKLCFCDAFNVIDPTFELPEDQWPMASILGKKLPYSSLMRQGLIISLIMFAEKNDSDNNCGIISTEDFVYQTVKETLDPVTTWQQWSTIAGLLPMLTEASPQAVIEKLEHEIKKSDTELWKLFVPSQDTFWGRNYYTHILWALETLVWYRSFAIRSVILLSELCEKNFDYKMVNSPANSLYEAFCLWYPQICFDTEDRLRLVKKICSEYPLTGQKLLNSLLPTGRGTCSSIHRPHWRTLEIDYSEAITVPQYNESVAAVIDLCVDKLPECTDGWKTIIKNINLFEPHYEQIKEKSLLFISKTDESNALILCDDLRERISSFRKFKDADWSITEEYADKLEKLLIEIMPTSINQYKYLFDWHPHLLHPSPHIEGSMRDYEADRQAIFALRANATSNIIEQFGTEALIDFCMDAKDVTDFAQILVENVFNKTYDFPLLLRLKSVNSGLYSSVLWRLFSIHELDGLLHHLTSDTALSKNEKGDILCSTPLRKDVWDNVSEMDEEVQSYYWQHVRAFRLDNMNDSIADYFINQLISYDRPFSAIEVISYSDYSNTALITKALERCLELQEDSELNGMTIKSLRADVIVNLFEKIYNNCNRDIAQSAKLELQFLVFFKYHGTPNNVICYLENYPEEYVMLLSSMYRPDNSESKAITEDQRRIANIAYDILKHFHKIPGCNNDEISEELFSNWVYRCKCYADKAEYCKAFEIGVGKLLSHSPKGSDGIFPHEFVRTFLENNKSETLTNEFIVGKINQRGVHTATGGIAEKELAFSYYADAEKIRVAYPVTAAILERLGDDFKRDSLYEQKRELMDFY